MALISIFLTLILIVSSIFIVFMVLIQRPKQEGLGTSFGGSSLDSALGAHTSDVLKKVTKYLGIIFFGSAILLSMVKTYQFKSKESSDVLKELKESDKNKKEEKLNIKINDDNNKLFSDKELKSKEGLKEKDNKLNSDNLETEESNKENSTSKKLK